MKRLKKIKLRELGIVVLIILALVAIGGYFSSKFFGHDNPIEEMAEDFIQSQTGFFLDLSPQNEDGEHHEDFEHENH